MTGDKTRERINADFIVIGSGAAGLRAALDLASAGQVLILTKTEIRESNSRYAQGGIAAAIGESDSAELHLSDTLVAGAGLCNEEAVRILEKCAGTQLDPAAVQAFVRLGNIARPQASGEDPILHSLHHLSAAVRSTAVQETRV